MDVSCVRIITKQAIEVDIVISKTQGVTNRILFFSDARYNLRPQGFVTLESLDGVDGGELDLVIA